MKVVDEAEDINLLWRMAARTDSRIEPIPVGQRQFEEDDSSAIIEIARREGQVVSIREFQKNNDPKNPSLGSVVICQWSVAKDKGQLTTDSSSNFGII